MPRLRQQPWEAAWVTAGFAVLTIALTAPLAFRLGAVAYRITNGDGQFSVWNTAWVAHALLRFPSRVFDANIFYPHTGTLAYSEANLGSGALAVPVYWATGNPYAAHGFVILLSFVLSGVGAYYLVRALTADRVAAAVAGIAFTFAPHVFAHLLHIQLVWIAGLPWTLLAFHHLIERPGVWRGVGLGLAMTATLYLCAYYAVFLVLVVAGFTAAAAIGRRLALRPRFWLSMVTAAAVSLATALPLLIPYLEFRQSTGFTRPLGASDGFSADWQAYFASAAYAHAWLLPYLGRWNEVLFPGFVATGFALVGIVVGVRTPGRLRETTLWYTGAGGLALWASFGPSAGLYGLLYNTVPAFSLMRAPSRFGVVVLLACVVLAGIGIAWVRRQHWLSGSLAAVALIAITIAEHVVPLEFQPVPPPDPAYRTLAALPDGAVLELPVYSPRAQFIRARYMLASTAHWKPLVNAYSDYIPDDVDARMEVFGEFPTAESLALLVRERVRYAVVHLDAFAGMRPEVERKLDEFAGALILRYKDANTRIYEIVGASQ